MFQICGGYRTWALPLPLALVLAPELRVLPEVYSMDLSCLLRSVDAIGTGTKSPRIPYPLWILSSALAGRGRERFAFTSS